MKTSAKLLMIIILFLVLFIIRSITYSEWLPLPEKVVNGEECTLKKFPYIVSIKATFSLIHVCGGSLIDKYNVLSAARCYSSDSSYFVVAGQTHFENFSEDIQMSPVAGLLIHPDYNNVTFQRNIAILRLQNPIAETAYTKYIQLPPPRSKSSCKSMRAAGWGKLSHEPVIKMLPLNLWCASLNVLTIDACQQHYSQERVLTSSLCTLNNNDSQIVCSGDSGGPLMCGDFQYGIVSSGTECSAIFPQFHTNVTLFTDFIRSSVKASLEQKNRCVSGRKLPSLLLGLLIWTAHAVFSYHM